MRLAGKTLRLEVLAPVVVHWSPDGWRTLYDTVTWDTGLGVHVADVRTATLPTGGMVHFTFYWPEACRLGNTNELYRDRGVSAPPAWASMSRG